ncbi:MAG: hypothetical protein Q7V53_04770 [Caldisericota bacterium]|nr:hypothetical protein [Caldisericota bacterium]
MSTASEDQQDDSIEIRLYMKVSKRAYPELATLLQGLPRRELNRRVKALVLRAALAETNQIHLDRPATRVAAAPMPLEQPAFTESGLLDGLTSGDLDKVFEFGMGMPAHAAS